jgi:hypothetical protein
VYTELYNISQQVGAIIQEQMTEVQAEELGLDPRGTHRLYVTRDTIAVSKDNDNGLQYYGGFQYVEKEYRMEMGEWVFYFADDERIADHLSQYYDKGEEA